MEKLPNKKKKTVVTGDYTANARIEIDYRGKRPTVKFSYPDRKRQFSGSMFSWIFMFWIIFLILLTYTFAAYNEIRNVYKLIDSPVNILIFNECVNHYSQNFNYVVTNTCYKEMNNDYKFKWDLFNTVVVNDMINNNNLSHTVMSTWTNETSQSQKDISQITEKALNFLVIKGSKSTTIRLVRYIILVFIVLFIIPALIYYPAEKKWANVYPKWNAAFNKKHYIFFKPKDIQKINGVYKLEIPLIENVHLRYNATEDFAKQMYFFEIKEHPFMKIWHRGLSEIRRDRRKAKRLKKKYHVRLNKKYRIDDNHWRATWFFANIPKNGKMEVVYL
jgi:hypothetical protein